MVHTELKKYGLQFEPAGLGLVWLADEARKRRQPLPLGATLHIGAIVGERLYAALMRTDSRGAACGGPYGELAPSAVVLDADGSVQVRPAIMSIAVTGEQPQSPEQQAGQPATARSDVFGLGLLLYGLLTNRVFAAPPGELGMPSAAPKLELPLEPPSKLVPLPPEVDAVLLRALEADPAARFADTRELSRALVAIAQQLGISAGQAEVAAMFAAINTPQAQQERDKVRREVAMRVLEAADELQALIAKENSRPLKVVGPPPSEELMKQMTAFQNGLRLRVDISSAFDDTAPLPPQAASKAAISQFTRLVELGFERLGIMWETDVLAATSTPAVVFAAPAHECFATVFFERGGAPMLAFTTPFESGEVVLTSAYPRREHRSPQAVLTACAKGQTGDVLAAHAREVAAMKQNGARPIAQWDRAAQLAATDAWYQQPDLWT